MKKRGALAAVVCDGIVYMLFGGVNGSTGALDTMECIAISSLLVTTTTTVTATIVEQQQQQEHNNNDTNNVIGWELINSRLSCPRWGCSVVCVHDRFLVILGGTYNGSAVSTVDIVDTTTTTTTTTTTKGSGVVVVVTVVGRTFHVYTTGAFLVPPLYRDRFGLWGGRDDNDKELSTVEMIPFSQNNDNDDDDDDDSNNLMKEWRKDHHTHDTSRTLFSSSSSSSSSLCHGTCSSWTVQKNMALSVPRSFHSIGRLGKSSCLVVVGGVASSSDGNRSKSVEVIDPQKDIVWSLPDLTVPPYFCYILSSSRPSNHHVLLLSENQSSSHFTLESLLSCMELSLTQKCFRH